MQSDLGARTHLRRSLEIDAFEQAEQVSRAGSLMIEVIGLIDVLPNDPHLHPLPRPSNSVGDQDVHGAAQRTAGVASNQRGEYGDRANAEGGFQ